MRKFSQDLQFLNQIETDQVDLVKIRQQRHLVAKIQSSLQKKDEEIQKLKSLLEKYQQYQQKYTSLKVELSERAHLMTKKDNQCKLLKKQIEELMREHGDYNSKIKQYEIQRQTTLRQRHAMEVAHKEIESTFKEYQNQFRKRQNALTFDLQRALQQIKQANTRIDELELIAEQKKQLQIRIKQRERLRSEERQKTPKQRQGSSNKNTQSESLSLNQQINRLKSELISKQQQLSNNRVLNYELTIEYDSSINTICTLQSQLSIYRRQNNQMKKILSLLRQQQRCKQIESKYTLRNKTQFITPMSDCQQSPSSEQDRPTHKHHGSKIENGIITIQT